MKRYKISKYSSFYCIGLSYKKASAEIRGKFALDTNAKRRLLVQAREDGIEDILVLSTCNRTEIYGFAEHPFQLIKLLCQNTEGCVDIFQDVGTVRKNNDAISHLFSVGTGLDSQILGDFEIISQLKSSFSLSKEEGMVNSFLERLVSFVIQASKRIKNETDISSGVTSVAYASVRYILSNVDDVAQKNILLFGTGLIGRNTCENLVKHTKNRHIVLINRTRENAKKIAGKFDLEIKDISALKSEIQNSDILIVATGAQAPTISKKMVDVHKDILILDLSIPKNVNPDVGELKNVRLVHLDQLSQMTDETISKREAQIPHAKIIIAEVEGEFNAWLETRKFAPTIKALKEKLNIIKLQEIETHRKKFEDFNDEQAEYIANKIVQKITNRFATHLKENQTSQTESIEFIAQVFQLDGSVGE